ncbi:MAG: glycosyltransferase family 4 protein [Candidatus Omnitrophica bacterium]|nr:glycosyltransferase family 4 protein [Candidatus Omnitrophota bacterium]
MAESGAKVWLFYGETGNPLVSETRLFRSMVQAGVQSRRLVIPGVFPFLFWFLKGKTPSKIVLIQKAIQKAGSLRKALLRVRKIGPIFDFNADVIHVEVSRLLPGLHTALELLDRPVVTSLRADINVRPHFDSSWGKRLKNYSRRENLYFHAVSNYLKLEAMRYGICNSKCTTIHQSIEFRDLKFPDEDTGGRSFDRKRLIMVSRLAHVKGVDLAISALGLLKKEGYDLRLEIVGGGMELSNLQELAARLSVTDDICFYGDKTDDWVMDFLAESATSSIFLQPSRREAYGQSILEAMASRLPIIAANVGGIGELISDKVTGLFFKPESPADLADKIKKIIHDGDLALKLSRAARVEAMKRPAHKEAEEFLSFYSAISKIRRRSSPSMNRVI